MAVIQNLAKNRSLWHQRILPPVETRCAFYALSTNCYTLHIPFELESHGTYGLPIHDEAFAFTFALSNTSGFQSTPSIFGLEMGIRLHRRHKINLKLTPIVENFREASKYVRWNVLVGEFLLTSRRVGAKVDRLELDSQNAFSHRPTLFFSSEVINRDKQDLVDFLENIEYRSTQLVTLDEAAVSRANQLRNCG